MADFFNKFVAEVNKGVKNIKTNSDLFVEKAELKNQISECNKYKDSVIHSLGIFVYNLYKNGTILDERLKNMLNEIDINNEKIDELNYRLEKLNNTNNQSSQPIIDSDNAVVCAKCGTLNNASSKFCGGCGYDLRTKEEE